ncbi:MAG: glycosyltransferase family 4 protein [Armatimonadota bacterium]
MFNKLIDYFHTRVNYFDLLKSRGRHRKDKLNLGWCSVFPPTKNGTAAASYYMVNQLRKTDDINLFLIPYQGRYKDKVYPPFLDKRMFKDFNITKIDDPKLDLIVLFLLGDICKEIIHKAKAPYIIWQTIHESINEKNKRKLFEEFTGYDCKKILLTNKDAVREYKEAGAENIFYFPLGIERSPFKMHKSNKTDFTVLFLSRIVKYKGIMPFLKSIPLVLRKCPEVKFKIHMPFDGVFKADNEVQSLIDSVKEKYPDNFDFCMEWVDYGSLSSIYKDASLLVFPSNNEGFGVPLVEAMTCGIPSIVLNKPPMNEIVIDNYNGFCLEPDPDIRDKYDKLRQGEYVIEDFMDWAFPSPSDIADKIIYLYRNKDAYDKLSDNCVKHSENFDIRKLTDAFVNLIKNNNFTDSFDFTKNLV